ncbi:TPA: hypothetical protein I0H43_RS14430, partial [Enterococcus faecalis]|nr:hypothetical protein [Enterococcus faecalis]
TTVLTNYIGQAKDVVIPLSGDLGTTNVKITKAALRAAATSADNQGGTLANSANDTAGTGLVADNSTDNEPSDTTVDYSGTFKDLTKITKIDLSQLKIEAHNGAKGKAGNSRGEDGKAGESIDVSSMFENCTALKEVNLNSFVGQGGNGGDGGDGNGVAGNNCHTEGSHGDAGGDGSGGDGGYAGDFKAQNMFEDTPTLVNIQLMNFIGRNGIGGDGGNGNGGDGGNGYIDHSAGGDGGNGLGGIGYYGGAGHGGNGGFGSGGAAGSSNYSAGGGGGNGHGGTGYGGGGGTGYGGNGGSGGNANSGTGGHGGNGGFGYGGAGYVSNSNGIGGGNGAGGNGGDGGDGAAFRNGGYGGNGGDGLGGDSGFSPVGNGIGGNGGAGGAAGTLGHKGDKGANGNGGGGNLDSNLLPKNLTGEKLRLYQAYTGTTDKTNMFFPIAVNELALTKKVGFAPDELKENVGALRTTDSGKGENIRDSELRNVSLSAKDETGNAVDLANVSNKAGEYTLTYTYSGKSIDTHLTVKGGSITTQDLTLGT